MIFWLISFPHSRSLSLSILLSMASFVSVFASRQPEPHKRESGSFSALFSSRQKQKLVSRLELTEEVSWTSINQSDRSNLGLEKAPLKVRSTVHITPNGALPIKALLLLPLHE